MKNEIHARLEATTPQPWYVNDGKVERRFMDYDGTGMVREEICNVVEDVDAEFIVHAPEDIAWLLAEVDRLTKVIQEIGAECAQRFDKIQSLEAENEQLRRERDALNCELNGICWACKNQKPWKMSVTGNIVTCEHLKARGVVAASGRAGKNCEHWHWRGIQEGG